MKNDPVTELLINPQPAHKNLFGSPTISHNGNFWGPITIIMGWIGLHHGLGWVGFCQPVVYIHLLYDAFLKTTLIIGINIT